MLLRVDLHGVSVFGRGGHHLVRWEWIEAITVGDGVTVRSASDEVALPAGAFRLPPAQLAERLEAARSIDRRPEVIASLTAT